MSGYEVDRTGNNELNFKSFAFQDSVVFLSVTWNWKQHSVGLISNEKPGFNKIFKCTISK